MIIMDYNQQNQENSLGLEVRDDTLRYSGKDLTGVTFRNYPKLRLDDIRFHDCRFENCNMVYLSDGMFLGCHIENVETLYADRSQLVKCTFAHLRCDNDCIISAEDVEITGCIFQDIELREESYICDGVGDTYVSECKFSQIRTDREDLELFHCEETVGKLFKKKKEFNIVERRSCTGLEDIQYIG